MKKGLRIVDYREVLPKKVTPKYNKTSRASGKARIKDAEIRAVMKWIRGNFPDHFDEACAIQQKARFSQIAIEDGKAERPASLDMGEA